jgi:hypothetical protein
MEDPMAFVIQIGNEDEEPRYWIGGEIFSVYGEEAARFVSDTDAEVTIDLFRRAMTLPGAARVVDAAKVRVDA